MSPLARAHAEAALEAGIKEAQVIEGALFGDIDDLGVGVAQERSGFEKAQFHPQRGDGKAESMMEQAVQVAAAATETGGEVVDRKAQDFVGGELLKNVVEMIF